jgi:hypothetical protein
VAAALVFASRYRLRQDVFKVNELSLPNQEEPDFLFSRKIRGNQQLLFLK